jgi:hypothetical protein
MSRCGQRAAGRITVTREEPDCSEATSTGRSADASRTGASVSVIAAMLAGRLEALTV